MNAHVSNIARSYNFELRRLAFIRRFLTSTATDTLVSAFVLFCNGPLVFEKVFATRYDVCKE